MTPLLFASVFTSLKRDNKRTFSYSKMNEYMQNTQRVTDYLVSVSAIENLFPLELGGHL